MSKAPQVNIEEALCEYLQKYYRGANNPVSSKQLEAVFMLREQKSGDWSIRSVVRVNPLQ